MSTMSPNMNLPISTVGVDSGLNWENNLNSSLSLIDLHDHTPGKGVALTPTSINVNSDFPFNNNNLTLIRSVRFQAQSSALALVTDIGCLYEAGVDLYYNDGSGNQIRITQSGSLAGAAGTITGLPSGTASAAYAAGVFTFQSATATGANIDGASHVFRNNTASSKGLTLSPPNAMAADYTLVLPSIPASTSFLTIDSSGNIVASPTLLGALTTSNLSASANIPGTQLSASANITGTQLAAGAAVVNIGPGGITATQLGASCVLTNNIADAQVTKRKLGAATVGRNSSSGLTCLNSTSSIPVTFTGVGRPVIITINIWASYDTPQVVTTHRTIRLKVNGSTLYTLYVTPDNITDTNVYVCGTFLDPNGNNGSLTYDILTDAGTAGPGAGTIELIAWEL